MDTLNLLQEAAAASGSSVTAHAGFPNPAAGRTKTPLSLDKLLITSPASTYFFRIRGHSWHDSGIYDGDIAIVDRARRPKPSAIVIYTTDTGELCVAKWGEICSQYAAQDATLWGVVTATIHLATGA